MEPSDKEPTPELTKPPTAARLAVATLFFINGSIFGTWVSRIPGIQAELGISHASLGLALLALALGALTAMPLAGRMFTKHGSAPICRWTALLFCCGLPLLAIVPGYGAWVAVLYVFGMCHGGLDVAMNHQAVTVANRYPRPIMSSFHALFSLGGLAGAAGGGFFAHGGVTPAVHFAVVGASLAAVAAIVGLPRLIEHQSATETVSHLAGQEAKGFTVNKSLIAIGAVAFCAMVGEGAMADWSGVFLRQTLGAGDGLAAAGYAAFSIAMATTRLVGDKISARIGPMAVLRWSGTLAFGGLAIALAGISTPVAIFGFACVGIGYAIVVPTAFSAAGQVPGISSGAALATVSTVGYTGFLLGPPIIGFMAEVVGLRGSLAMILVTCGAIVVLAPAVRPRRRGLDKIKQTATESIPAGAEDPA